MDKWICGFAHAKVGTDNSNHVSSDRMGNKLVCNVEGLFSLIYKSTMDMVSQIAQRSRCSWAAPVQIAQRSRYSWAAPVGLKQHSQTLPHKVKIT